MKKIFKLTFLGLLLTSFQMQAFPTGLFSLALGVFNQFVDVDGKCFEKRPVLRRLALSSVVVGSCFGLWGASRALGLQVNSLVTGKPLSKNNPTDDEKNKNSGS